MQRSAPPAACTTSTAVEAHALSLTEDVVAMAEYERQLILAIARRTSDPEAMAMLNQLAIVVLDRREHAKRVVAFLWRCVAKLQEAEAIRDWDGLADLRCFTGKEIAGLINPLLDAIASSPQLDEIRAAQAKLVPYFETFGAGIFEGRITYSMNTTRRDTLSAEFTRWRETPNSGQAVVRVRELAPPPTLVAIGGAS